jgi:hypothetical protein
VEKEAAVKFALVFSGDGLQLHVIMTINREAEQGRRSAQAGFSCTRSSPFFDFVDA